MSDLLVHPHTVRVYMDDDYFTKPDPFCACLHCYGTMTHAPPKIVPRETIRWQTSGRDASKLTAGTDICCDNMCAAALMQTQQIPLERLRQFTHTSIIRVALPRWTLQDYRGPLSRAEFCEWKKLGVVKRLLSYDSSDVLTHIETPLDQRRENERYRRILCIVMHLHKQYKFVFDPRDSLWSTEVTASANWKCYTDGHSLQGQKPITRCVTSRAPSDMDLGLAESHNAEQFGTASPNQCSLLFCSPGCALRHLNGELRGEALQLAVDASFELWKQYWFQNRSIHVESAPDVRTLTMFDGLLTIDEYRRRSHAEDVSTKILGLVHAPVEEDFPFLARIHHTGLWQIVHDSLAWTSKEGHAPLELNLADKMSMTNLDPTATVQFRRKAHLYSNAAESSCIQADGSERFPVAERDQVHVRLCMIDYKKPQKSTIEILTRVIEAAGSSSVQSSSDKPSK